MDALNRIEETLVRIEKGIILVSGIVMLSAVTAQVFFRYVVPLSVPWTEELSIITFVLIVFYGATLASYHERHLGIKNVVDLLSDRAFMGVWILQKLALLAFLLVVLIAFALPTAIQGFQHTFTIIKVPLFYLLIQIPVFGLLTAFHTVMSLLRGDYRKALAARNSKEK